MSKEISKKEKLKGIKKESKRKERLKKVNEK